MELDYGGFVRVDSQLRTAEPTIFAIGDVVGGALLAHKATREGRVAAEVIAFPRLSVDNEAASARIDGTESCGNCPEEVGVG